MASEISSMSAKADSRVTISPREKISLKTARHFELAIKEPFRNKYREFSREEIESCKSYENHVKSCDRCDPFENRLCRPGYVAASYVFEAFSIFHTVRHSPLNLTTKAVEDLFDAAKEGLLFKYGFYTEMHTPRELQSKGLSGQPKEHQ